MILTPSTAPQVVALSTVSAQSAAVGKPLVLLQSNSDCFYMIGDNPRATTSGHFLAAGLAIPIRMKGGEKVAAILASSTGSLYITPFEEG